MAGLGKSCLRWLLFYVAIAAAVAALAYARFPHPRVAVITGCILGFPLWLSCGYIVGIVTRRREAREMRKAMTGEPLQDGEKVAVSGAMRGSSLEAPITRRRCVLYEYKVLPHGNDVAGTFEGFAMSGVVIEGSRGAIRLLALPELAFDGETPYGNEAQRQFEEYVVRTSFTIRHAVDLRAELAHLQEIREDEDGAIRYDIRREIPGASLSEMSLQEKVIVAGERVVAVGRYSESRRALVPDPTAVLHAVKVMKGEPEQLARNITKRDRVDAPLALGCMLPVLAATLLVLALIPVTTIEQLVPNKVPSAHELRLEQWLDRDVRPRLAQFGITPWNIDANVYLEANSARGFLTIGDRVVHLDQVSGRRDGDAIELRFTGDGGAATVRMRKDGTVESMRVDGEPVALTTMTTQNLMLGENEMRGRVTCISSEVQLRALFRSSI
jgi:hypothetical protein